MNEDRKELKKILMSRMQHPDGIEKKGSILCKQKFSGTLSSSDTERNTLGVAGVEFLKFAIYTNIYASSDQCHSEPRI
jgi:hypothetical protein